MRYLVPSVLILIGAGFIVYGATDGEAAAVIKKAIAICMECIGLG
ncbi:MAG: thioredoxin [Clostridia bacterium]|nr:thioredoxin [Clostridia bacterium]